MRYALLVAAALVACGSDDPVDRLLGAECDVTADCDDRCLGPSNDYPDGFCSLDCSTNGECPEAADCIDLEGGICLFRCVDDPDCAFLGPEWVCRDENLREDQNVRSGVCLGN